MTDFNIFGVDPYELGAGIAKTTPTPATPASVPAPPVVPSPPAGSVVAPPPPSPPAPSYETAAPTYSPIAARTQLEEISVNTRVPVNVLMALTETVGAQNDEQTLAVATRAAEAFAPRLQAGETIEDIVTAFAGDPARSEVLLTRARAIGAELYPDAYDAKSSDGSGLADFGKQLGAGIVRGVGYAAEGLVRGLDMMNPTPQLDADGNIIANSDGSIAMDRSRVNRATELLANPVRDLADKISAGVSDGGRAAVQDSMPDGDLFKPSTWTLGKEPSLEGYALLAGDVLGSFLPIVAAGVIGGPIVAGIAGGSQSGGAAADQVKDILEAAAQDIGEDGKSRLETESAYYRELIASGATPDEALARTIEAGESMAFMFAAPIGAFGGALTQKILSPGTRLITGGGRPTQMLLKGGASALEEGTQEVLESVGTRAGVEVGTGLDQNLMEGTFADFVMGAMGGGPIGLGSGAIPTSKDQPEPAPTDISTGNPDISTGNPKPGPTGPLGRAATLDPGPIAPEGLFEGDPVVIRSGATEIRGAFQGEDGTVVRVKDEAGQNLEIPREEFADGNTTIGAAERESAPDTDISAPEPGAPPTLAEQALLAVQPPQPEASDAEASPDELERRLRVLEQHATDSGWTPALQRVKDRLTAEYERLAGVPYPDADPTLDPVTDDALIEDIAPEDITEALAEKGLEIVRKADGDPFSTEAAVKRALKRKSLDPEQFDITAEGEGFIAAPKPKPTGDTPAIAPEQDISADFAENAQPVAPAGLDGADPESDVTPETSEENERPTLSRESGVIDGTFQRAAEGSNETNDIAVTPQGPWNFNDTWPSPDPERLAARLAEGRNDFDAKTPEDVVETLEETLAFAVDLREESLEWDEEARRIAAGQKPSAFPVAKGMTPAEQARKNADRASEDLLEAEAALRDVWSDEAVDAMASAIEEVTAQSRRVNPRGPDTPPPARQAPRARAVPMPAPKDRVQPDMFGARDQSEVELAGKEKARREWGQFLGIADNGKSVWDGEIEGYPVAVRGAKVSIYEPGDEKVVKSEVDVGDMSRTDIARWARGQIVRSPQTSNRSSGEFADRPAKPAQNIPTPNANAKILVNQTGGAIGSMTKEQAKAYALDLVRDGQKTGGMRKGYTYSFDQWFGKNRVKKSSGKLFITPDNALDAFYFDVSALRKAIAPVATEESSGEVPKWADLSDAEKLARSDRQEEIRGRFQGTWRSASFKKLMKPRIAAKPDKNMAGVHRDSPVAFDYVAGHLDALDGKPLDMMRIGGADGAIEPYLEAYYATRSNTPAVDIRGKDRQRYIDEIEGDDLGPPNGGAVSPVLESPQDGGKAVPTQGDPNAQVSANDLAGPDRPIRNPSVGNLLAGDPVRGDGVPRTVADQGGTADTPAQAGREPAVDEAVRGDPTPTVDAGTAPPSPADGLKEVSGAAVHSTVPDIAPSLAEIAAAAKDADATPTDAQKEAGNYKMGHIAWNGLDITIENAKGSTRSGTDSDGETWSVKMPAHYGYIKRTEGADGDHVDVYMGDATDSDAVFVIDQNDIETGKFDEHKIVLGAEGRREAEDLYDGGFSDGKGPERRKGVAKMTVAEFKEWLISGDQTKPVVKAVGNSNLVAEPVKQPGQFNEDVKAVYGAANTLVTADRAAKLRARLKEKLNGTTLNAGIDPEIMAMGAELAVFHIEAGSRRFLELARAIAGDLGTTPAKLKPYLRSWYNGARDMMEDNDISVDGMDGAREVGTLVKSGALDNLPPDDKMGGQEEGQSSNERDAVTGSLGARTEPSDQDGLADGQPGGERPSGALEDAQTEDVGRAEGVSRRSGAGARSDTPSGDRSVGNGEERDASDGRTRNGGTGLASDGTGRPTGKAERKGDERSSRRDAGRANAPRRAVGPPNFHIEDPAALIGGTPKVRFARNRAALEAFMDITAEGREPTSAEIDAMAGYTGWGSYGQELFQGNWANPRPKEAWVKEDAWLREHLGQEQWESAQRSIINAHYTDPPTVQAMWDMARQLGFQGGRVLEPAMGIGNFFGMLPRDLETKSDLTGIELDDLTGGMAKVLYPQANISIKGYETSQTPDDFYDLVIGNWPFAKDGPADRRYGKLSPSLHDYFFVKALDQVRPGGLVIGVTSAGTMDKQAKSVRSHLAENATLVAAYRLPSGAFMEYAGTKVVTDILILKKRPARQPLMALSETEAAWIDTVNVATPSGQDVRVNKYFADNPSNILGTLNFGSGSTYGRAAMIVDRPNDLDKRLKALAPGLPAGVMQPVSRTAEPTYVSNNTGDRNGAVVVSEGKLFVSRGEVMAPLNEISPYRVADRKKTAAREDQLRRLVDLRKLYGVLIDAERDGAADVEAKRKALNAAFKAFRKAHGRIVGSDGIRVLAKKSVSDPFVSTLEALENPDGSPARIMSETTVRSLRKLENPSVRDAFMMARNETHTVDLDRVAEISKRPVDDVATELLASNAIHRTPGDGYEVADLFKSGNVRRKLREVEDAMARGEDLAESAAALKSVIPEDVPYYQIEAKLGATWAGDEVYRNYISELLGLSNAETDSIEVRFTSGTWKVRFDNARINEKPEAKSAHGHIAKPFSTLFQAALNNQTLKVERRDSKGAKYIDETSTAEVNEKIAKLRENYADWLWKDAERRVDLEAAYNETMNAVAIPQFDGPFLEFPGMALQRGEQPFNLRKHQVDAIWRGIANGRGLYAHEVGTGKTYTMGGIAVESRRLGLARKPMLFAHNANSGSVAAEIQEMYPGAKVLYVDNLAPKDIDTTMRRIANDDWDVVVVPHSTIDRFALSEETLMDLAREEIEALESEALLAAEEDGVPLSLDAMDDDDQMKKVRSVTAKNLVKARNQIITRIQKQAIRSSREGAVKFEDLGIDMMLIDETQEFKKPPIATRMQMKGLNTSSSARSIQMKFLTDYVKRLRGGKGIHSFTGTPITNTLTEIFHQMRYVMDDVMDRSSVKEWDAWFNTFADAGNDVELSADGQYEPVTRLSAFVNVAELRRMAGEFMDIVFADDMPEFKKRQTKTGKTMADDLNDAELAELRDGRSDNPQGRPYMQIVNDIAEMGPAQTQVMKDLVERATRFRKASRKDRRQMMIEGSNAVPIRVETDAANASLDVRLAFPRATDEPTSKANRAVANILNHFNEHPLATQVVFMERGFSDASRSVKTDKDGNKTTTVTPRLNLAYDIVEKLVAGGMDRETIAIVDGGVNKAKRKEIAIKMNRGDIRLVIGSTNTLGVGVNMQENLRAMHHLDAPWMPGDLTQRNGRGERQGNRWNTVKQYRYITEKLDGRRWQVLTIKDQFIRAFMKADGKVRVIDGEATSEQDGEDASNLAQTLSDAAGDPRLLLVNKIRADIDKLERRERIHVQGTVDAKRRAKWLRKDAAQQTVDLQKMQADAAHATSLAEAETFTAAIDGISYDNRKDALDALDALIESTEPAMMERDARQPKRLNAEIQGFSLTATRAFDGIQYEIDRSRSYRIGKPSIRSIEQTIRGIPKRSEDAAAKIEADTVSADRLEQASTEDFAQQGALARKKQQLSDLETDMEQNPAPPPAWLRNGAPVQSRIYTKVDGKLVDAEVEGHRWASDAYLIVTDRGEIDYSLALTEDGSPIFDPVAFEPPVVQATSTAKTPEAVSESAKEARAPAGWDAVEAEPPLTDADLRRVTKGLNAELKASGLEGKVRLAVVREVLSETSGSRAQGVYRFGEIDIRADSALGPLGVLRHEIVHALRHVDLWGKRYGLFTQAEWRGLVNEAKKDKAMMAGLKERYPDLPVSGLNEEAVAEMYRSWRDAGGEPSIPALAKIRAFLEALANALRGQGFQSAASTMQQIASGKIAGRSQPRARPTRSESAKEFRPPSALNTPGPDERKRVSQTLTDAMSGNMNLLGLVPGRALFAEMGKNIPAAGRYLTLKENMDALRSDWHGKTDEVSQAWRKILSKNGDANKKLMDLMHRATLAGVDPSKPFEPSATPQDAQIIAMSRPGTIAHDAAVDRAAKDKKAQADHARLKREFDALPRAFQEMFGTVRDAYSEMADSFEAAVLANVDKSMVIGLDRAKARHARDMQDIKDDGLTGDAKTDAEEMADTRLADAKKRNGWSKNARLSALRAQFESNRVTGPYFPLMRFGQYFATVRDRATGVVQSFSRFETEREQAKFAAEMRKDQQAEVQVGVVDEQMSFKDQVDPNFVADIEELIGSEIGDPKIMDMVWQRWLETLPDFSMRRSRIHRKGRAGYDEDAFRAFGRQMFHGSHQIARLTYAMDMQKALEDSRREAATSDDPNRAGLVVTEMEKRHEFAMNPTGSKWAQGATSAAFIYYLGVTPAAAMVNLTQTTLVGVPVLSAGFKKGGIGSASRALTGALRDFAGGRGHAGNSKRLTSDEKSAMEEAYRRGTVDRTQSHDLAGVAETGVEYSDIRQRWMGRISFLFHHAERLNREVTFLAAYRMARARGFDHDAAIDKGADLTWKTHFDYQNTSRPRLMQNDVAKVLLVFRNFQINMLWRLFRDAHQSFKGKTTADRREARAQLIGITLMMTAQAGVTGTWGYALVMMFLGLFAEGGSDEIEEEIKTATVELFGPDIAGMLLKGVPGHLTGTNLSNRIGMPELWFRSSDRQLEGRDVYSYWLSEIVGAVPSIVENQIRGIQTIREGKTLRGIETMAPKFIRDILRAGRYLNEGVTTYKGDPIVDEVSMRQALIQALGFTPAQIAERYEENTRMKNKEKRIIDSRRDLLKEATDLIRDGKQLTPGVIEKIQAFNAKYPTYPVTSDTIKRSLQARQRASAANEYGVIINPNLNARIRSEAAPSLYD